ncbi:MAG: YncE family protein [Myxococcota bacterium]
MTLLKSRYIQNIVILLIFIISLPAFIKILDFSRFVIFTTNILELLLGIVEYFFVNYTILSFLTTSTILLCLIFITYRIFKRRLYLDIWFLTGFIVFLSELLPFVLLRSVKVELLMFYLVVFSILFLFILLKNTKYDFFKSFALSSLILFPLFAIFLLIGFNASAARPKKTILNGGPEHNWYDERCDRKRLLSQPEIKPVWIEDAWLYGGVATGDGRYIYFSDNGYGIVGFELMENGEYRKLPFIKYPPDFNAALYSHRLYLTPDEKYIFYYGARSAEFVFIDREKLEVAYVIPTKNGLDGFSATIDTRRNLIYGFPFIGKEVPVLSYEDGIPRLIKWIDFSQVPGWAIQGVYDEKRDILIVFTSSNISLFNANNYYPIKHIKTNGVNTRYVFDIDNEKMYFSNEFLNVITLLDLNTYDFKFIEGIPAGIRELFYIKKNNILLLSNFSTGIVYVLDLKTNLIISQIYVGQRIRGALVTNKNNFTGGIILSSSCGIFEVGLRK